MYGREYNGKTLSFEASGGLKNSSLIMQDFETNSYWAIMEGEAIGGEMKGTKLVELPVSKKTQWKDWVKEYPNTLVLSVNGQEDAQHGYKDYFTSSQGFRGQQAEDKRLQDKEPIFSFRLNGKSYAVPHIAISEGKSFLIEDRAVFLYRPESVDMFYSTVAFLSKGEKIKFTNLKWSDEDSGCSFNPESEMFEGKNNCPEKISGFDTFWYNWSLNNPETVLLK